MNRVFLVFGLLLSVCVIALYFYFSSSLMSKDQEPAEEDSGARQIVEQQMPVSVSEPIQEAIPVRTSSIHLPADIQPSSQPATSRPSTPPTTKPASQPASMPLLAHSAASGVIGDASATEKLDPVSAAESQPVAFSPSSPGLAGQVEDPLYSGPVQRLRVQTIWEDNRQPIPDVLVHLMRNKGGNFIASRNTDANGFVEFDFPKDWTHVQLNIRSKVAIFKAQPIDLPTQQPYVVQLKRGTTVFGRVLQDNGLPAPLAEVHAVEKWNRMTVANAKGEYQLPSTPGEFHLMAAWKDSVSDPEATPVSFPGIVGPYDIILRRGQQIVGTVKDADTGLPISGAQIKWIVFEDHQTVSDSAGNYRLGGLTRIEKSSLPFEFFDIVIEAEGYGSELKSVPFFSDPEHRLDLTLEKAGTVAVTVVDQDGQPVNAVQISISGIGSFDRIQEYTDRNGYYLAKGIRLNTPQVIYAFKMGYSSTQAVPVFAPGAVTTTLKFVLNKEDTEDSFLE